MTSSSICEGAGHHAREHGHRAGPAAWRVHAACPACGDHTVLALCAGRVEHVRDNGLPIRCDICGHADTVDMIWHRLEPVAPVLRIVDGSDVQPDGDRGEPSTVRPQRRVGRPGPPLNDADRQLLDEFADELHARACTGKTVAVMMSTLRSFAASLPVPLPEATRAHIVEWLATPGWAPVTRRTYRTTINSFYSWMVDVGRLVVSPAPRGRGVRVPYTEPDPLSTQQIQQLLDSGIRTRTRLMVLLAAYQGMRASEIAAAHADDIDLLAGTIRIPCGKGGTDLRRPLHTLVADTVDRMRPTGFLFPGLHGHEHVTGKSVSSTIGHAMRRAGIVGHRPHQLRAWHATELVRAGTDTVTVQHAMRHATLGALHKYVHPDAADVASAIEQLPRVIPPTVPRHPRR